jgi:hypothetical protein
MPRTVTLVFASIYLAFSLNLLGEWKSNAREAAAAVAAQAQPADVILITPAWYASSFNYYYIPNNLQCNYPHEERRGAIDIEDLRDRLVNPELMERVRASLVRAHREGRRVWLLTDRDTLSEGSKARCLLPDAVLEGDRIPEGLPLRTFGDVAQLRAIQLQKQLDTLYGTPNVIAVPSRGREGLETFEVLLYAQEHESLQHTVDLSLGSGKW